MQMKSVVFALLASGICALSASAKVKPIKVTGAPFELTVREWTPPELEFRISDYAPNRPMAILPPPSRSPRPWKKRLPRP